MTLPLPLAVISANVLFALDAPRVYLSVLKDGPFVAAEVWALSLAWGMLP